MSKVRMWLCRDKSRECTGIFAVAYGKQIPKFNEGTWSMEEDYSCGATSLELQHNCLGKSLLGDLKPGQKIEVELRRKKCSKPSGKVFAW